MSRKSQAFVHPISIRIMKVIFFVYVVILFLLSVLALRSKKIDMSFDENNIIEWNDGWQISIDKEVTDVTTIPASLDGVTTETITIRNKLPYVLDGKYCLLIESKRQDILVYINNGLRKNVTHSTLRQGRSLPYSYVMVPLKTTEGGASVAITMRSDSVYSGEIGSVYLGDQLSITTMLIRSNIIWFILIIVLSVIGVLCFSFKSIYRNSFDRSNIFAYLGGFCIFTSVFCFNLLRIKQFFVEDLPLLEVFGYCALMLVPFTILMIAYGISSYKHSNVIIIFSAVSLINFIAQQLLHNILQADYFSMQVITQILILVILAFLMVMHLYDKEKGNIRDTDFVALSSAYLIGSILLEGVSSALDSALPLGSIFLIGSIIYVLTVMTYCFLNISKENEGKKKAELANQAKSAFLASMSHEIRTPINAIVGINEIIARETNEESTRKYASNIADASNSLLYLVNDILDYSKIESGKLDIVCVDYDVPKFLEEMTILVEARLHGKNLDFKFDIDQKLPCTMHGDIARIKQVCINLLTNAIKYTEEGGFTFTIKCQDIADDTARLYFSVKDTGIGIKEEDRAKIMDAEFIRLDAKRNYSVEGTGLGLSISTSLLKLMGSELKLESVYGEGSDFYFTLDQAIIDRTPICEKKSEKVPVPDAIKFSCPDAKILVVDDTKTNLIVMKGLLKQFGIKASTCDSGRKCIEECRNNKYDIIFLDIMMPELSGVETLEILKAENIIGDTPVVALTANAISGAKESYMVQGFNEYMTKPFQMTELEEMLIKLLEHQIAPI